MTLYHFKSDLLIWALFDAYKEKVIYIGLAHHGKDVKMKWVER